jgi:hypothetical protein
MDMIFWLPQAEAGLAQVEGQWRGERGMSVERYALYGLS